LRFGGPLMRPLVALVALVFVAIIAFAIGATIVYTVGDGGALVALALFGIVLIGATAVAFHDHLERRRALRNLPVLAQVKPRRIRQGRP
jgi:hypothetical protein